MSTNAPTPRKSNFPLFPPLGGIADEYGTWPQVTDGVQVMGPGYRGRLTVNMFIFDLWILVMFDPTKKKIFDFLIT